MDLSFISLKKVLPVVWKRVRDGGCLLALVKPQFEATRAEADAGKGVIRDETVRRRAIGEVRVFALKELFGAVLFGEMDCPVHGGDGNREYFLGLRKAN